MATRSVPLSRFSDFFSKTHILCGSQAHLQKNQLRRVLLSMFVYTADLVLLVGFSQSRTPVCVCVCVFVNRVTTTPQNFSALLDPSSYSFLSNSDLSVEVHLWRRVRFPSRGFRISYQRHMSHVARKVILRQISGDRRFCACLRTQETWSYLLGSVSREPVCVCFW